MLLHGATADEVDATRTDDHLGADPVASFVATAAELNAAFREPGAMARTAYHPAGERTGAQLLDSRVLDVTVHTWDLGSVPSAQTSRSTSTSSPSRSRYETRSRRTASGTPARPTTRVKTPADLSAQARLLHLSGRLARLTRLR